MKCIKLNNNNDTLSNLEGDDEEHSQKKQTETNIHLMNAICQFHLTKPNEN